MVRVRSTDTTEDCVTVSYVSETVPFVTHIMAPYLENKILRNVIDNLWKTYQYNQEYISFLLNTRTRDEFMEAAKKYSLTFRDVDAAGLYYQANVLLQALGQPLTSADLSLLLNVDPNIIENVMPPLLEYNGEETETDEQ
ncbi:MAG: hypothetical protein CVU64_02025 [Deltaproteobacteria bacterium HGW-Deltaproteobacteria-21]|nr:MAG: hypothetical protein CVU64_02025 [Deltaproteobacteria bacterium HGW-Deltaproteobacteria-21]